MPKMCTATPIMTTLNLEVMTKYIKQPNELSTKNMKETPNIIAGLVRPRKSGSVFNEPKPPDIRDYEPFFLKYQEITQKKFDNYLLTTRKAILHNL